MRETNISILPDGWERYDGGNWTAKKPRGIVKNRLPRGGSEEKSESVKSKKKKGKKRRGKKGKREREKNPQERLHWYSMATIELGRFSGGLKWRRGQEWENSSKPNPGFCSRTVEPANPLKKYGYILYHFPSSHLTSPPTIYSPFLPIPITSFYNLLIFPLSISFSSSSFSFFTTRSNKRML